MSKQLIPETGKPSRLTKGRFSYFPRYVLKQSKKKYTKWCADEEFTAIFKVNGCGANFNDKVFEFDAERDLRMVFSHPVRQHEGENFVNGDNENLYLPSNRIFVFSKGQPSQSSPTSPAENDREAIIVLKICCCTVCTTDEPFMNGEESDSDVDVIDDFQRPIKLEGIDATELQPVNLKLILGKEDTQTEQELNISLFPGCTDKFNLFRDAHSCNRKRLLYYGTVKLKELEIFPWRNFEKVSQLPPTSEGNALPVAPKEKLKQKDLKVNVIKVMSINPLVTAGHSSENSLLKRMLQEKLATDFDIISSEGQEHPCHKSVLAARSKVFERMVAQSNVREIQNGRLVWTDEGMNSKVAQAFLEYIYHGGVHLINEDFHVAAAMVKLGHKYDVLELMAVSAKIIIQNGRWDLGWVDVRGLWNLYHFVRLLDQIHLMVRLKNTIILTLRKLVQRKKNKRFKPNEEEELDVLDLVIEEGQSEIVKGLIFDILQLIDDSDDDL